MIRLKLESEQIPFFCQTLNEFDSEFDIHNGRSIVDGKSLMGLYSLDYNREVFLKIINNEEELDSILKQIHPYIEKSSGAA